MMSGGEITQENAHMANINAIEHAKIQNQDIIFTGAADNQVKAWKLEGQNW